MKFALALKPRGALGLLQQPVHGFDEAVAAVINHPADGGVEPLSERGGQLLERLEPAAPRQLRQALKSVLA